MMFLPGPSFLIHLIILSIIKLTKKEEFLFEKKQSANYFAFVIIFIVSSIVFLSAFILIKTSFKYSTNLIFVSHVLTTGEALAAGEKPVQIKKEVHRREAPVEAAPVDFGMDVIDVFGPFEIKVNDFISFQSSINLFTELNELPRPLGRGIPSGKFFCGFVPAASLRLRDRSDSRRPQGILPQNKL